MQTTIDMENFFDTEEIKSSSILETTISRTSQQDFNKKMLEKLSLRFLNAADIEELKILCEDWFPIKYPDSWYKLVANDERFYSLAAVFEQKIIAVLIAEIKPRRQVSKEDYDLLSMSFNGDTKVAYILSLGVHRAHRRQGIASYLLHHFLTSICTQEKPHCQEVKAIYLHVLQKNTAAIKFYEQNKFQFLHYLPAYYIINGTSENGCSYVLHINGGKPPLACFDCLFTNLRLLSYSKFFKFPNRFLLFFCNIFKYVKSWPTFSPFIAKQKQCCDL